MGQRLVAEVIHVVPPDELDDHELQPELQELAASRYVLVCRKGGKPSWLDRLRSFLLRDPIEPVTVVTDTERSEGDQLDASVRETTIAGVYETVGE